MISSYKNIYYKVIIQNIHKIYYFYIYTWLLNKSIYLVSIPFYISGCETGYKFLVNKPIISFICSGGLMKKGYDYYNNT